MTHPPSTRHWRTTIILGALGITFSILLIAIGNYSIRETGTTTNIPDDPLPPEALPVVALSLFIINGLPYTLILFFILGLRQIFLAERHPLLAQGVSVISATAYTFVMATLLITQYILSEGEVGLTDIDAVQMLTLALSQQATLLFGVVIFILGLGMRDGVILPRWMGYLTLLFGVLEGFFGLFTTLEPTIWTGLSFIVFPTWQVIVCALLLLKLQAIQHSIRQS